MWVQHVMRLPPLNRGFHLVTSEILRAIPELAQVQVGVLHVFIQHTSASLSINECADPSVRADFESFFNEVVAEDKPYYLHTDEGSDDMPAHLKSSILGCSLSIPVTDGCLQMGTWQGIYMCEHRNHASGRRLVLTLNGSAA